MATWYNLIKKAADDHGEKIIECTLTTEELHRNFDAGFGSEEGSYFTAWSDSWVYFPICYDGAEWCGSAPRNPCDIAMKHQGGG